MSKNTDIPSEIRSFLNEKRRSIIIETFSKLLESIKIPSSQLGGDKRANCQLTNQQLFQLLIMMPFFAIKDFSHYSTSVLSRMFGGKKDIIYSFMPQDNIDWRNLIYRITTKLIIAVTIRKDYKKSLLPTVLIADDSDLPKNRQTNGVHRLYFLPYAAQVYPWVQNSYIVLE